LGKFKLQCIQNADNNSSCYTMSVASTSSLKVKDGLSSII